MTSTSKDIMAPKTAPIDWERRYNELVEGTASKTAQAATHVSRTNLRMLAGELSGMDFSRSHPEAVLLWIESRLRAIGVMIDEK